MQTAEKLRPCGARDKIGYAMGDLGCNLSFQLISSYMFLFYTQCIGLTTTNGHGSLWYRKSGMRSTTLSSAAW